MLYSCNKKAVIKPNTPLTYAITANVDGKEETFDSGDSVRNLGTGGIYFTGTNDTTHDKIGIYAYNFNTDTITTGFYTDTIGVSGSQIVFYPSGDQNNYYYSYYSPDEMYPSFLTISALSAGKLQGSFNGSVVLANYISGGAALSIKTITNGTFNIATK